MDIIRTARKLGDLETFPGFMEGLEKSSILNDLSHEYQEVIKIMGPTKIGAAYHYTIVLTSWDVDQQWRMLTSDMEEQRRITHDQKLDLENSGLLKAIEKRKSFWPVMKAATLEIGLEVLEERKGILTLYFKNKSELPSQVLRPVIFHLIGVIAQDNGLKQTQQNPEGIKQHEKLLLAEYEPRVSSELATSENGGSETNKDNIDEKAYPFVRKIWDIVLLDFRNKWEFLDQDKRNEWEFHLKMISLGLPDHKIGEKLFISADAVKKRLEKTGFNKTQIKKLLQKSNLPILLPLFLPDSLPVT